MDVNLKHSVWIKFNWKLIIILTGISLNNRIKQSPKSKRVVELESSKFAKLPPRKSPCVISHVVAKTGVRGWLKPSGLVSRQPITRVQPPPSPAKPYWSFGQRKTDHRGVRISQQELKQSTTQTFTSELKSNTTFIKIKLKKYLKKFLIYQSLVRCTSQLIAVGREKTIYCARMRIKLYYLLAHEKIFNRSLWI